MGTYIRLVDINDAKGKESAFLSASQDNSSSIRFETSAEDFSKIPGSPVAYWVSGNMLKAFSSGEVLKTRGDTRQGMATSDNNRFLRFWYEVNYNKLGLNCSSSENAKAKNKKWFPYNKGGEYRKWYGNIENVINYENDGFEVKQYATSLYKSPTRTIKSISEYFKHCLSWSKISSGSIAFRYYPIGFVFDVAGCCIFYEDDQTMFYDFGFINSKISRNILSAISPTLNYEAGHIASLPLIRIKNKFNHVCGITQKNVKIAKTDWDSFETSWDFKTHPFITHKNNGYIETSFKNWEEFAERQFYQLKINEEELNRIFIDMYGLQDELTPDVEEKDVTVRKADLGRDIRSFISYAVGCMLGRYSLDVEGLAYAGGDWDQSKYKTYIPDADNCIPITDEEYFDDDVVSRFVDFVKAVYGKDTLEKNLEFIAEALGNRGDTPLKTIRNYFINEFYKDHLKTYQKRPIYWLFESGKENSFKALIYMHRYNADTIGNMRIEYIHKLQVKYESQLSFEQHLIDTSQNQREKSAAIKQKEKLIRQIKEIKDYDVKIAHLANCRIEIDLDDGVKVNYEKVQTGKDGKMLEVLGKI